MKTEHDALDLEFEPLMLDCDVKTYAINCHGYVMQYVTNHIEVCRFLDLEMDINTELGGASNDKIMKLIDNVARFKYENIRTIPLAKVSVLYL